MALALLTHRAVLSVSGPEARTFLQGLVTNDLERGAPGGALYAGLLTPQGKLLFDFLVIDRGADGFLLDCEATRAKDLAKRLTLYRLRAKVAIDSSDLAVGAQWDDQAAAAPAGAIVFRDPRLPELGWRIIALRHVLQGLATTDEQAYRTHRLGLGVPDSADLPPEQIFPLDAGFEELNGVSFRKGCYVGQEVTARMKHRSTARRRVLLAETGREFPPGTPIHADGREIGVLASGDGSRALAHIRLDRLAEAQEKGASISVAGCEITLQIPSWIRV